ncbi:hypothetical protein [Pyrococcus kukulkanii]|uniref:Uncharacterized protein n=1 Tax=Pyrococcus kukulkanii TaxID=1609559 RepID=A0ABV4T8E4_9EURY
MMWEYIVRKAAYKLGAPKSVPTLQRLLQEIELLVGTKDFRKYKDDIERVARKVLEEIKREHKKLKHEQEKSRREKKEEVFEEEYSSEEELELEDLEEIEEEEEELDEEEEENEDEENDNDDDIDPDKFVSLTRSDVPLYPPFYGIEGVEDTPRRKRRHKKYNLVDA